MKDHLVRCFNNNCKAAFTIEIWEKQDYVCPTCKEQIGDVEDQMLWVECEMCGRCKQSLNPTEDYCCGRLMAVMEDQT
jgi:ribosomal protein L37AE/L43A